MIRSFFDLEAARLRTWELEALKRVNLTVALTADDARLMTELTGGTARVLPIEAPFPVDRRFPRVAQRPRPFGERSHLTLDRPPRARQQSVHGDLLIGAGAEHDVNRLAGDHLPRGRSRCYRGIRSGIAA